jgi:hypothetical protein
MLGMFSPIPYDMAVPLAGSISCIIEQLSHNLAIRPSTPCGLWYLTISMVNQWIHMYEISHIFTKTLVNAGALGISPDQLYVMTAFIHISG